MSDNHEERCPICRTKWKITTFGAKIWKDCLECEDTAENLIAKAEKETPSKKYEGADWLKNIQLKLDPNWCSKGGWSDYDDFDQSDDDEWGDIPF